ncbi:hypothetical protein LYNGBM3L_28060 [Moorena producens 3L]|uniref:Uncharacterized protein n=1 Tax=Moorena producens 3L TaxID=489825 RepID=F4XP43_9CYAN|nr:hypothetical protein LYNGBM3L_28060 [Moorena producens 3L]
MGNSYQPNLSILDLAAVVGNRELRSSGSPEQELRQTLSEQYFCKRSTIIVALVENYL